MLEGVIKKTPVLEVPKKKTRIMQQPYVYKIFYRIRAKSDRESSLLQLSKAYGLDIGSKLIDRVLKDSLSIVIERKRQEANILERERQIAEEKKHLYGGG